MGKSRDITAANAAVAQVSDADLADYFRGLVHPTTSNPGSEKILISDYEYARFHEAAYGSGSQPAAAPAQPSTKAHWFPKALVIAWAIQLDRAQKGIAPDANLSELEDFHQPVRIKSPGVV